LAALADPIIWLTAGLYGLALFNCVHILGDRQSPSASFAWIILNLALPIVGVPAYVLLGKYRIRGYIKRRSIRNFEFSGYARDLTQQWLMPSGEAYNVPAEIEPSFGIFRQIFSKFGPVFEPHPGEVKLLVDGKATFEEIFRAIASAKRYILVQYYILRSDRLGLELKRLLIAKAQAGLPVYLLYDDMGSFWLKQEYIKDLRRAGIRVEKFLPIRSLKRGFQINFRNHRKLVVVDGVCAFTGGLNIGEEYAERRLIPRERKFSFWRDTHMRIVGPAVFQLEELFLEDWHFATHETIDMNKISPPPELLAQKVQADAGDKKSSEQPAGELTVKLHAATGQGTKAFVQIVPSQPTDEQLIGILLFMQIIQSARKRLWIATPYFVPDTPLLRELELAALRGVDIRLILPRKSDNQFVHWVTLSYAEPLQSIGVKVCLYEKGFMHQKVALVDDNMAVLGSTNFDNRALYLNFETTVLVHGQEFAAEVEKVLREDLLSCRYHQPAKNWTRRKLVKTRENVARLLSPLL
jgi:cardiolipin synthase